MAKLTQEERDSLKDEDFAVPGKRELPIKDETHVREAWDMVDRTEGLTSSERASARRRIKSRAKELGIDTSDWGKKVNAEDGDEDADDGIGITKEIAGYTDKASNSATTCSKCAHYESAQGNCQIVLGKVSPSGWCKYFAKGTPKKGVNASFRLQAMSLDIPTVQNHPNRMPFSGVLTRVGVPSDKAPHGSSGKRVLLTAEAAQNAIPSLLGMGVDLTADLDGHDAQKKVGVITAARLEGDALMIEGFIYAADFPKEALSIHVKQAELGFSFEAQNLAVESIDTDPLVVKSCVFTGAAILMKDAAAYQTTSLAAAAAKDHEMTKEMQDAIAAAVATAIGPVTEKLAGLDKLAAQVEDLKKNPPRIEANTVTIDKVEPHAKALEAAAMSCEAAGVGLHATRGHVAVMRRMAGHMRAEAAQGKIPHEYNDGHSYWASAEQLQAAAAASAPKVEDSEQFKKLASDLAAAQQQIKDLKAAADTAKPAPERKTLPPLVSSVLAKAGIGMPEGDQKLSVGVINAALDKVAGLSFGQRAEVKLSLQRAGLLDPTAVG